MTKGAMEAATCAQRVTWLKCYNLNVEAEASHVVKNRRIERGRGGGGYHALQLIEFQLKVHVNS